MVDIMVPGNLQNVAIMHGWVMVRAPTRVGIRHKSASHAPYVVRAHIPTNQTSICAHAAMRTLTQTQWERLHVRFVLPIPTRAMEIQRE